jgi:epsin
MDFDNLKNQVSNLTLYDLKAGVRKVQNGTFCLSQ